MRLFYRKILFFTSGIFLFSGIFSTLFAQDKTTKQIFQKAQGVFENRSYNEALRLFRELDSIQPNDSYTNFFLGLCYLNTKTDYSKAIQSLSFTIKNIDSTEKEIILRANLNLGKAYQLTNRFDEAISTYNKITANKLSDSTDAGNVKGEIEKCLYAKQLIKKPVNATIRNLGPQINSAFTDYGPLITADEAILMFTSMRSGNVGGNKDVYGQNEQYIEDIYVSQKNDSNFWLPPKNIGPPINTESYDATVALSVDGEKLFLCRGGSGGIFVSDKDGINWTEPKKLNKNINSGNSETSVSLSSDGRVLYFTSSRKGGFGGKDIYKSELQPNGEWGPAENLGKTVNTSFDEESPFIHPDNKILYFSSLGHKGMGGFDVFKTEKVNNQWTEPENLGYPINTSADDIHFILSAKGLVGYYASNRPGGFGEEDIYEITFPMANIPLTMVRGTVITEGKKKQNVKIKIIDKETNEQIKNVYTPNSETGKYLMIFPPGKNYQMLVDAEGYLPFVFDLYIPNQTFFYSLYQTIYLKPITMFNEPIGQGVSIENSFSNPQDSGLSESEQRSRDILLLSMVQKIIENSDTARLGEIENIPIDKKDYTPLNNLIEKIIDFTDSTALGHLEKITSQGFIEKANSNIFFYGENKKTGVEPFSVGNDTIYIIPPSVSPSPGQNPSPDAEKIKPITEKIDEIDIKTVLNKSVPFEFGMQTFSTQYADTLLKIAELLKKFPKMKVEINGHTDNVGSEKNNQILSEIRAQNLARFFTENGVEKSKIYFFGKGETQPIMTNETNEGRAANRRADIRITETIVKQSVVH